MDYRIVADSCCDLTPELRKDLNAINVPLNIVIGNEDFIDDETLDIPMFMEKMKNYKGRTTSGAPSPILYKEAFLSSMVSFAVTLSSNLSSSYSSALIGKQMAEEEGAEVYVFDSKSASAGEALISIKIHELIKNGLDKLNIISFIEKFIKEMKTYFVLDSLENLVKNGRLNKISGEILTVLNIKPIMGSDGNGNIALFSNARGQHQIITKLSDTIAKSGKKTTGESMVISHCNNQSLAEKLRDAIKLRYDFNKIFIIPTRGISSMYANDKGIIMAF